mmetsp:Transcript_9026/g.14269  ORF Transcript_9026/g.14269 Transcript_9026/m.14269 type:complete len:698 (+) Transcript_9026:1249-3342(+)
MAQSALGSLILGKVEEAQKVHKPPPPKRVKETDQYHQHYSSAEGSEGLRSQKWLVGPARQQGYGTSPKPQVKKDSGLISKLQEQYMQQRRLHHIPGRGGSPETISGLEGTQFENQQSYLAPAGAEGGQKQGINVVPDPKGISKWRFSPELKGVGQSAYSAGQSKAVIGSIPSVDLLEGGNDLLHRGVLRDITGDTGADGHVDPHVRSLVNALFKGPHYQAFQQQRESGGQDLGAEDLGGPVQSGMRFAKTSQHRWGRVAQNAVARPPKSSNHKPQFEGATRPVLQARGAYTRKKGWRPMSGVAGGRQSDPTVRVVVGAPAPISGYPTYFAEFEVNKGNLAGLSRNMRVEEGNKHILSPQTPNPRSADALREMHEVQRAAASEPSTRPIHLGVRVRPQTSTGVHSRGGSSQEPEASTPERAERPKSSGGVTTSLSAWGFEASSEVMLEKEHETEGPGSFEFDRNAIYGNKPSSAPHGMYDILGALPPRRPRTTENVMSPGSSTRGSYYQEVEEPPIFQAENRRLTLDMGGYSSEDETLSSQTSGSRPVSQHRGRKNSRDIVEALATVSLEEDRSSALFGHRKASSVTSPAAWTAGSPASSKPSSPHPTGKGARPRAKTPNPKIDAGVVLQGPKRQTLEVSGAMGSGVAEMSLFAEPLRGTHPAVVLYPRDQSANPNSRHFSGAQINPITLSLQGGLRG